MPHLRTLTLHRMPTTFFVTHPPNLFRSFVAPRMYDGELGKWLVSAFEENGTGRRILLNRGWLPHADQAPVVEGEVTITGRVRCDGARNSFTPANDVAKGSFFRCGVAIILCWLTDRAAWMYINLRKHCTRSRCYWT